METTVHVGKNGITPGLVTQLTEELKRGESVKVRMLHSFLATNDRHEAAAQLATATKAGGARVVGNTVTLRRKK